jgi:hypothetical protein
MIDKGVWFAERYAKMSRHPSYAMSNASLILVLGSKICSKSSVKENKKMQF